MGPTLTLAAISERTGIPVERLRYVVDQKILPDTRRETPVGSEGRGRPRVYTEFQAFTLGCAALLLDAGLRRRAVTTCIEALMEPRRPAGVDVPNGLLSIAFRRPQTTYVEVGDGRFVRLGGIPSWGVRARTAGAASTAGWHDVETPRVETPGVEPLVTVRIDAAKLRRLLGAPE